MKKYTEMTDINYCRICLEEEGDLTTLISPCKCSGSSKYVHIECLQTWRRTCRDSNNIGEEECMECKTKYLIRKNVDRERIIKYDTVKLLQLLYYTPVIISLIVYSSDSKDCDFITFLDGGEIYPTQKCTKYVTYYQKNETMCYPLNLKGYVMLDDDMGFGFIFYLSIMLSMYSSLIISTFSLYQLKILKNPSIFFKKYNLFYLFLHIIISLRMFIIYYSFRFTYPFICIMLSCISVPLEAANITKAKGRYKKILQDINHGIADDDTILTWTDNYVEGMGYDMIEIDEIDENDGSDSYDSDDSDL